MKRNCSIVFLLVFSCISAYSQTFTLKESVETAIKNNPLVQLEILEAQQAEKQKQVDKSSMFPAASMEFYQSTNTGRSIDRFTNAYINQLYSSTYTTINVQQPIFRGFENKHFLESNQNQIQATILEIDAAKNDLQLRVFQSYLEVLRNTELLKISQQQWSSSNEQLDIMKKRKEAGMLAEKSILQLKSRMATEQFAQIQAENALNVAKINFFTLLNIPVNMEASFAEPSLSLQESENLNIDIFPEIQAQEFRINSLEARGKAIKSRMWPRLDAYANWNTFYASSNAEQDFFTQIDATRNGSFTLGLSIPLFAALQNRPQIAAIDVQKRIAMNSKRMAVQNLNQAFLLRKEQLSLAKEAMQNAELQIENTQQLLDQLELQAENGTLDVLEYIVAKADHQSAQLSYLQQKYSRLFNAYMLQYYANGKWDF